MPAAWILALSLLGQHRTEPDEFPLALHRSMELDDLDRELRRQHENVLVRKAQLATTQRLAQRGVVSRTDLERETADVRYQEAREAEMAAYRALKAYERDVMERTTRADEARGYALLLDLLKKQEAMAQVELDFRAFLLKQAQALRQRNAISRQELEGAEFDYNAASANVALSQARQAQVAMELAARTGKKGYDRDEHLRLKAAYHQARIHYYEIMASGARSRLDRAKDRARAGLSPETEVAPLQKAYDDALEVLAAERRLLDELKPPKPPTTVRTG